MRSLNGERNTAVGSGVHGKSADDIFAIMSNLEAAKAGRDDLRGTSPLGVQDDFNL